MKRVGVDIGGTFTDLVLWDDETGSIRVHKTPSTPDDLSVAAMRGVEQLCAQAGMRVADVSVLIHGTTVATNTVIEHSGARVGLITTRGFRDILHIARKKRPLNFSHYQDIPWQTWPLVRRRHRLTVSERICPPSGQVLVALNPDEVRAAAGRLREAGVDAVAICFLFSFLNPEHEDQAKRVVEEEYPGTFVSVSHEVVPLFREYERLSTTCLNAYIGPRVAAYADRLAGALRGLGLASELHLMTSAGGLVTAAGAREKAVSLLMSGPVAGLIAGIEVGRLAGHPNVISLDMGGTSADIGVAPDGRLRMKHLLDTKIGSYDAMVPMVDVDTIGAGGGSIAYVDVGGMFRVGPRSAGAVPGPASYGLGGTQPTATDALLTMGWLRPESFLAGGVKVRPDLAREAIRTHVAEPLRMSVEEASAGIFKILTHSMIDAIGVNSIRKGYDPRDFVLVALGGAGPAFAAEIARQLSIPTVVVPLYPGIGAAIGLLSTDMKYEYLGTMWENLSAPDLKRIERVYRDLTQQATQRLIADGFASHDIRIVWKAECRYAGQGYELPVDAPVGPIDQAWVDTVVDRFHAVHERAYLRHFKDKDVQIINLGVAGIGRVPTLQFPRVEAGGPSPERALVGTWETCFPTPAGVERAETRYYDRARLQAANIVHGPAVIEQLDSTTVLPPGARAAVDAFGQLIMSFDGE